MSAFNALLIFIFINRKITISDAVKVLEKQKDEEWEMKLEAEDAEYEASQPVFKPEPLFSNT